MSNRSKDKSSQENYNKMKIISNMDASSLLNSLLNGDDEEIELRLKSVESNKNQSMENQDIPEVRSFDAETSSNKSKVTKKSF